MEPQAKIAAALVKAQKAFGPALKNATNPHFRSKYADLSSVLDAIVPALNANGIALMQRTKETDGGVSVETVLIHESGETFSTGWLYVPAVKNEPQPYGSALSYCRRYSALLVGVAPEDDDGNAAQKAVQEQKPEPMPEDAVADWISAIEAAGADELQAIARTAMEKAQEHKDREAWLRFRAAAKKLDAK